MIVTMTCEKRLDVATMVKPLRYATCRRVFLGVAPESRWLECIKDSEYYLSRHLCQVMLPRKLDEAYHGVVARVY